MTATLYQKISGPFKRDRETNKLTTDWSSDDIAALADAPIWQFTEKVDGTNIRIVWDGHRVSFGGRTDNAQIPTPLLEVLESTFGGPDNEQFFEQKFGQTPAILFGEGYGPKIQNGGKYRSTPGFVLFDVLVGQWMLLRDGVEDVADYFRIDCVPLFVSGVTLNEAIEFVRGGVVSNWGEFEPEGLVGITEPGLRSRNGERIAVKLKVRDLR